MTKSTEQQPQGTPREVERILGVKFITGLHLFKNIDDDSPVLVVKYDEAQDMGLTEQDINCIGEEFGTCQAIVTMEGESKIVDINFIQPIKEGGGLAIHKIWERTQTYKRVPSVD
jgi:hypothetical protein